MLVVKTQYFHSTFPIAIISMAISIQQITIFPVYISTFSYIIMFHIVTTVLVAYKLYFTAYKLCFTAYKLCFTAYKLCFTAYKLCFTAYKLCFTAYKLCFTA